MFNNPLRKYQSGGSTQSAEQALYNTFEKASEILGVSVDDLYNAINKVDDPEVFMQAMESLESKDKDVSSAAFKYFSDLFNSNKMRNGGKVKDFICKHAKGGKVNCGCGGLKVAMHQKGDRIITQKDTTDTYSLPNGAVVERRSFVNSPRVDYTVSSYKPEFVQYLSTNPRLLNTFGVFAKPFVNLGIARDKISPQYRQKLDSARDNVKFNTKNKTKK